MARLTLSARALKVTIPLDAAEVAALPDPGGQARCQLAITCDGKVYTADIATKALRKAKSTISANGAEIVFAMVQGKLKGNEIIDCGLVAQVKTPKPDGERCLIAPGSHPLSLFWAWFTNTGNTSCSIGLEEGMDGHGGAVPDLPPSLTAGSLVMNR
jgi:hypothetical protein